VSVTYLRPDLDTRPLSVAEERRLARRIDGGDLKAKATMIERNLRLVQSVANSYRASGVPVADLVQEGTVGLMRAVDGFDHRRGLRFSTYAMWWIRRSILDAIAASNVIRIPTKANQQLAAVRRAEAELARLGPARASDAEIAERAELSVGTVRSLRSVARVTASLDETVGEEATRLGDVVADPRAIDPSDSAIAREDRDEVESLLRLLPERHREVLVRRFGLNQHPCQDHREIGQWLGVGAERSRQLEREALHRLRSVKLASARAA
jgi:RNA polymerase primary sigma factor